ncbi:LysR family transcriptional regulator substrate-binding protein [Rhodococcus sp. P1Y]|uniref:LysR family transcriptional regulator substrate-binding protein n=1 Tax=Rhodococcus sp. P1Y TaxID=1302308 RepID=UPI001F30D117|nr:LysR family transcriptional regulator substrate-binding protein [Rhodococcus sp. P1Y]
MGQRSPGRPALSAPSCREPAFRVTGTVRIGVIPTASAAAADIASPLSVRHPLVSLHRRLVVGRHRRPTRSLRTRRGITYLDHDVLEHYRCFPLYEERYVLLTADDPTVPRRAEISWHEASAPMYATVDHARPPILDEHFAEDGTHLNARIETDSVATLYAHVKTGQWSAVVPSMWSTVFGEPPGLRCTPLTENLPAPVVGLITRLDGPSSILVEALEETASTLNRTSSESPINQ